MRFGYVVRDPTNQRYSEIRDLTVKVESLGFESVHVTDHFFRFGDIQRKKAPKPNATIAISRARIPRPLPDFPISYQHL